jgi:hypothetical protein
VRTIAALIALMLPPAAIAQAPAAPAARPADVASIDGIIAALYDVISGPSGAARDWDRMRTLFYPGARFIPSGRSPDGARAGARVQTVDQYIEQNEPWFVENGFFERELARETQRYAQLAHVFSTYEAKHRQDGPVIARGVNSIQLLYDGTRWWVLGIMWAPEVQNEPLPGIAPGSGAQHDGATTR